MVYGYSTVPRKLGVLVGGMRYSHAPGKMVVKGSLGKLWDWKLWPDLLFRKWFGSFCRSYVCLFLAWGLSHLGVCKETVQHSNVFISTVGEISWLAFKKATKNAVCFHETALRFISTLKWGEISQVNKNVEYICVSAVSIKLPRCCTPFSHLSITFCWLQPFLNNLVPAESFQVLRSNPRTRG